MSIQVLSHGKINLTLEVLYRRRDGFHQIETIMQEIGLADEISLEELSPDPDCGGFKRGEIQLKCDHPLLPDGEKNLAYRAASLFISKFAPGKSVKIELKKKIPVAAGLGGGSSNAAAVLKGLRSLWGIPVAPEELLKLAASLGSDVPFFLYGGTALAEGRGELISPAAAFPHTEVLLASPKNLQLSAAEVYQALLSEKLSPGNKTKAFLRALEQEKGSRGSTLTPFLPLLVNDLEEPAFSLQMDIKILKERLSDMGLAPLMSGSGPTVFTLSENKKILSKALQNLRADGYYAILTNTINNAESRMQNAEL